MNDVISDDSKDIEIVNNSGSEIVQITEDLLFDARNELTEIDVIKMPIDKLATLGGGVASLLPQLRRVTQTTTIETQGLYRLANESVGDVLKLAKDGNFWGAFKTAEKKSKMAKLAAVDPLTATNSTVLPIDPATMMMAVALYSIEKQLGEILEMEKQILSFLETEKESGVEADVETLIDIIKKYKLNWDNEHFVTSNHKMVLDIQRTARKNMISYQKRVVDTTRSRKLVVTQKNVDINRNKLQKDFKYYQLSLYSYALASLIEILLSGNFKEEYISQIRDEIQKRSMEYREAFQAASLYLEKMERHALDTNALKGLGVATKATGNFIGSIPVIKEGQVDEFLQDGGMGMKNAARKIQKSTLRSFSKMNNPGTGILMDEMSSMISIYNYTNSIAFDKDNIYLMA